MENIKKRIIWNCIAANISIVSHYEAEARNIYRSNPESVQYEITQYMVDILEAERLQMCKRLCNK